MPQLEDLEDPTFASDFVPPGGSNGLVQALSLSLPKC